MNKRLQTILEQLQKSESLTPEEKKSLIDALKESDKEITITEFKLERTEKVKRTTAILLEETIAELEEKRKAVEAQNRELEIEAALERVRSKSIAMHQSSELGDLSFELVKQVQALGIATWHCAFNIYDEGQESSTEWGSNVNGTYPIYKTPREGIFKRYYEIGQKGVTLHVEVIGEDRCADHYAYLCTLPGVGETLIRLRDSGVSFPKSQIDHVAYFKFGYLLFITFEPATEAHDVFKRFAKVFEQTYTRFLDLQKAEAQTREAQIEAALEKVRASAMAMHNSDDISATTSIVFTELQKLGIQSIRCGVGLLSKDSYMAQVYAAVATSDGEFHTLKRTISMSEHSSLAQQYRTWLKQENYQTILNGDDLRSYYDQPFFHSSASYVPPQHFDQNEFGYYFSFSEGLFYVWTEKPYSESELNILNRFKTIIALTFRRFLDLQKAEAQAREAKIEAGLERVRSKAMAMRTSEELNALIGTVFTELTKLDLVLTRCVIMTYDLKTYDSRWWMANSEAPEQPMNFFVQYHEHPPNLAYFSAWRELTVKWIYALEGTIKKEWDYFLFNETELKLLPDFVIAGMKAPDRVYLNASFYNSGNLTLASLEPLSDEHFDILIRFSKVFDLTYTRFNDLKQAEAQTWEAKIEAAIERVRSRTMAMQRSDELLDVASILFQQVKDLGVPQWDCGFCIWDIGDKECNYYPGTQGGVFGATVCRFPLTEHPVFISMDESRKRGDELFVYEKEGEFQADHYRYMLSLRPGAGDLLQSMLDAGLQFPTFQIDHVANFSYGCLLFITYEHFPEMHDVFKRFAKVFEQTYTRFLDLQKAEAQAREAQIEAALERVRSRSMAMHRSEELLQVITVVSEQLQNLNFKFNTVSFAINNREHDYKFWFAPMGQATPLFIEVPYVSNPMFDRVKDVLASGGTFYSDTLTPEESKHWHEHVFAHADFSFLPEETKDYVLRSGYARSVAITPSIMLIVSNYAAKPFSDEQNNIIKRFAVVFEQSYTRFLDLQKAEAQAREARIETALERVRSKTMAMHHSEELKEVIAVTFEQIKSLDIVIDSCIITLFIEGSDDLNNWVTSAEQKYPQLVRVPYFKHLLFDKIALAKKKPGSYFTLKLSKEENKLFYTHLLENSEFGKMINEERRAVVMNAESNIMSFANFKHTGLRVGNFHDYTYTPAENNTILRFANVFEQTYTRFLDLQKAEAQAREAQIEASLERVRSRSLAMHKSDELAFVVDELFLRLRELEIGFDSVNILQFTADSFQIWAAYQPGKFTVTKIPYTKTDIPYVRTAVEAKNRGQQLFTHQYLFEEKNLFLKYLFEETHFINLPEERKQFLLQAPCYTVSIGFAKNTALQLQSYSRAAFSENENALLMRFLNVFEQCYTRFLDLQKAEAQAREAQIEVSLERVRSKAMAMHKSEDLTSAVAVVFDELEKLDLGMSRCGIGILSKQKRTGDIWTTSKSEGQTTVHVSGVESMDIHPLLQHAFDAWLRQEDFTYVLRGQDLADYYSAIQHANFLLPESQSMVKNAEMLEQHYHTTTFQAGALYAFRENSFTDEAKNVMKRFANVFSLTYKRFQDIQKAEALAREAQIEASLERVRSKTMAMHNSHDVGVTVATLFDELTKLGVKTNRCGILIFSTSDDTEVWAARSNPSGEVNLIIGYLNVSLHPLLSGARNAWKKKETTFSYEMIGEDLINYYQMINNQSSYPFRVNMEALPSKEIHTEFYFPDGAVFSFTPEPVAPEDAQIFKRLAGVFGQTYRRYLDLQKAEAQAREAQVEAALEQVRSRSLIMRESTEIKEVISVVLKKIQQLGIAVENRSFVILEFQPGFRLFTQWIASPLHPEAIGVLTPYFDNPILKDFWEAREKGIEFYENPYAKEDKDSLFSYFFDSLGMQTAEESKEFIFSSQFYSLAVAYEQNSAIGIATHTGKLLVQEEIDLLRRFARVYEQSYTRFLDLKKAEEQAKEATIEAALEKVRGKAMAMHNSNDLTSTASLVFTELRKLGINSFRSGVGLLTKENSNAKLYSATTSTEGDNLSLVGWAALEGHVVLSEIYNTWLDNKDYFPVLKGDLLTSYYEKINSNFTVPTAQSEGIVQYGCFLPFSEGTFYGWSEKPYTELEIRILHRFKAIIDLTFRRYMELQKSEANALEAIRQASLDRVRAEIASMRTTSDLDRITPLIWKELNTLNVPFVRCGVFIMDEPQQQIHTFLSTPEGKAIAAFHLPYDAPGNVGEILSHWQKNETYLSHWDRTAFRELGEFLIRQGAITTIEVYMNTVPGDGIYLHCLPFMQGMLYVGNTTQLKEDEIQLIQSVADAFATAYARYEDFNKLEAAKQQVDKTLNDLKQTQNQLVISEKMASLGELTAGIAHEIQNPLNFVNNFSEVSNELLNEMNQEIEKGNFSEVKAITEDVRKNLEKILHHGKRADGIVKGMLQHSRSSSGVKEPTDINVLADEYLRLAFHGFRAKDKSFNATTKTDFDESVGKINVVPQEIGRVVLNLITNAFYTVSEKKKQSGNEYEPTVTLKTKKQNNYVLISVIDNGNGISPTVLDKIFQPFFTTKPTGQGTGLGLSLSYDIVKAHSGELTVKTKQGEGSEFTFSLSST